MKNFEAQAIAKRAMNKIAPYIVPGVTEADIRKQVEILLIQEGSTSFWYHGVGALVHVGSRTLLSQNGKEYRVSHDTVVQQNDVVTLDLAPALNGEWGDYARTYFVENGKAYSQLDQLQNPLYIKALQAELELHEYVRSRVTPETTYEQLYKMACEKCSQLGCTNLDYTSNWGHSVNIDQKDRIYLVDGNKARLGDSQAFTFEPHLQLENCNFGVKRENIYYFDQDGKCLEL